VSRVYLDHNATSLLRDEARAAMDQVLASGAGNPSSPHARGRAARAVIDDARQRIAGALRVDEEGIIFTSGGTEADNLAVLGTVRGAAEGRGLVTTLVEHPAVLGPALALQQEGRNVVRVPVDAAGRPATDSLLDHAHGAALVAVQAANSELGTCPDLASIGRGLRELEASVRPKFFTDAVQALGRIQVDLEAWGADLAAFSAHKVGGPTGCGVLVRRGGSALCPLVHGGGQEDEVRPGTENVSAIAGAAVAIELAVLEQESEASRILGLSQRLWHDLRSAVPDVRLLGPDLDDAHRLPNTLCILLPGVNGRMGVTQLDLEGLEVSAGSACSSGSLEPSPVLRAIGLNDEDARGGLRISLGRTTTEEDIHIAVETLSRTSRRARKS
tara:strand:+ start:2955 stop:4112 length:1158 start_codon:yes stop_codon:yes gene_type:complete